jgi:hypothetical protein
MACVSPTACWAVGSYGGFGGGGGAGFQPQAFIDFWNGSSWSVEPSPEAGPLDLLNSVTCVAGVGCTAAGMTAVQGVQNDPGLRPFIEQLTFPPASSQGYLLAARDGGVFAYGTASFRGSMGGTRLNAPVVGLATTPDGQGYWLVASDGGVFAFGDARFAGSMGGTRVNAPVVGIAAAPSGGYWLAASDGGIFSFGSGFYGSANSLHLTSAVTGIGGSTDGRGYWLVARDGGVFSYGDAPYEGSVPGQGISGQSAVVGVAATPSGQGYWLTGDNGAVYSYGDATFLGAPAAATLAAPVVGMSSST